MEPVIHTRALVGLTPHPVTVECHLAGGLPGTTIVGLPESAVKEARDRVRAALDYSGFTYPGGKVVINLAPGQLAKASTALDLPIALALLAKTSQIRTAELAELEFLGELGLYGELRKAPGALACALATGKEGRKLIVPEANSDEAAIAPRGSMRLAATLKDVVAYLNGARQAVTQPPRIAEPQHDEPHSLTQVVGQSAAKRAMTIAAAGGHHLLMVGPPGTGKTMLARGFSELLPTLSNAQSLEVAAVYSAAGMARTNHRKPPIRAPHHSASAPALVGGGSPPRPGEIALAHHGVLFLDELPHFQPSVLNLLREPIENGTVTITRAAYAIEYPCHFQLIAAMNPCPAGRTCTAQACRCTASQVQSYQSRISGPLLDRIDLHVQVPALPDYLLARLQIQPQDNSPAQLRNQVEKVRRTQANRQNCLNAALQDELKEHMLHAELDDSFLQQAINRYKLSARSYAKTWRIARTIADLEDSIRITSPHLTEALSYRALDWEEGV